MTNLGFNSSDAKKQNRELLDPQLRQALEYALPRQQIIDTVFGGEAKPWANILSAWSGDWVNPKVQPLPHDVAKANEILDSLGYQRGPDSIRTVPATQGEHAQPAHPMRYSVVVPNDTDYDGHLQFTLLQTAFKEIGVELTEQAGGDGTQAYQLMTAPDGKYEDADMFTWYWRPYIDPDFNLGVVTTAELNNNSDTGWSNPDYDTLYDKQRATVDPNARRALVWQAEETIANALPYIQIAETNLITAHSTAWTGFEPTLMGYGKAYFTSPRRSDDGVGPNLVRRNHDLRRGHNQFLPVPRHARRRSLGAAVPKLHAGTARGVADPLRTRQAAARTVFDVPERARPR